MLAFAIRIRYVILALAAFLALVCTSRAFAQGVPEQFTNQDVIRMIQAGLPESVIVNKVNANAGHLDTSVDALVLLKKAGATDAELNAFTKTSLTTAVPAPVTSSSSAFYGGVVTNDNGNVTLYIPDNGKGNMPVNLLFHVVLVNNLPALLLEVESDKWGMTIFQCTDTHGDLVITKEKTIFYPYARGQKACKPGPWQLLDNREPISLTTDRINPHGTAWGIGETSFSKDAPPFWLGNAYHKKNQPTLSEAFLNSAFKDFPATMTALLLAARVSDPSTQLDPQSRYEPKSKEQLAILVDKHNKEDEFDRAQHPKENDGLVNGLAGAVAIVSSGANVLQQQQTGNAAGELAALQEYNQTVAKVVNGQTPPPVQSSTAQAQQQQPDQIQATLQQGQAKLAATYARIQQQQAQPQQAQQALQRAQQQLQQIQQQQAQQRAQQQAAASVTTSSVPASAVNSRGTGLCPNGRLRDDAARCDCGSHIADNLGYTCANNTGSTAASTTSLAAASRTKTSTYSPATTSQTTQTAQASTTPTTSRTQSNGSVFNYPSPQPNTGGQFGSSTGAAAPPSCIYLSPTIPCLSPSTWQEIQSAPVAIKPPTNTPTGPPQVYYIVNSDIPPGPGVVWCPRTGHIETGYYTANDVWIGQQSPCTVGFHVRVTWPALPGSDGTQYASASGSSASGSSGPGSGNGSATGSGNGSGSGGSGTVSDTVTPLCSTVVVEWVQDTTFPNKQDLFLHNYCAQELSVKWILGNEIPSLSSLAAFARRNSLHGVRPGQDNHVSVYACPMDHPVAVDAKGIEVYGQNQPYSCKKGNPPHDALTPYQ